MARTINATAVNWSEHWPRIKEMLDQGYSAPQVSSATGIKTTSINSYCSRIGYKIQKLNKDKIRFDNHDRNLMVLLRLLGCSLSEVAEKFETSYHEASRLTSQRYKIAKLRLSGVTVLTIASRFNLTEDYILSITTYVLREFYNAQEKECTNSKALQPCNLLPAHQANAMAKSNGSQRGVPLQ